MAINKIELIDLDDEAEMTGLFENREVIEMAVGFAIRRTAHILEKRIHNYYTPEDAIAMAYLQGRFDVELEEEEAKLDAELVAEIDDALELKVEGCTRGPDQVIKPKGIESQCAFGSDKKPKKIH